MSAVLGKNALTTVQIALGFTSCNFPVAAQYFLKLHSLSVMYAPVATELIMGCKINFLKLFEICLCNLLGND